MFGTRADLAVDLFLVLLLVLLPVMLGAVALVRRGRVRAHRAVMIGCFWVFLAGVAGFEVRVRFGPAGPPLARTPLVIHLSMAVPCLLLWAFQIRRGRLAAAEPARHRRRGLALLALLALTVATGFWLYAATFTGGV